MLETYLCFKWHDDLQRRVLDLQVTLKAKHPKLEPLVSGRVTKPIILIIQNYTNFLG